jgi:hypothetical protein
VSKRVIEAARAAFGALIDWQRSISPGHRSRD